MMKKQIVKTCALTDCQLSFILGRKDKKTRRFCSRDCYKLASRTSATYTQIWHNGKREYLHRVIYMTSTGEKLTSNDIIHHIDENKQNNDISNLEKLTGRAAHLFKHNYHKKQGASYDADFGW